MNGKKYLLFNQILVFVYSNLTENEEINNQCKLNKLSKWIKLNNKECKKCSEGWYSGIIPTKFNEVQMGKLCIENQTHTCYLSNEMFIQNCGQFFIYKMKNDLINLNNIQLKDFPKKKMKNVDELNCETKEEINDYKICPLSMDDGHGIGDVMPYFDRDLNELLIYYLKDIWNDEYHQRHPWFAIKTNNFTSYQLIKNGELLSSSNDPCSQDYAIGTGSIIKKDKKYYAFYTGHNPNSPSFCINKKEGIMLATSANLNSKFEKDFHFKRIYPPIDQGFDEENNFRDPLVIYDSSLNQYKLIVSARTIRGVIISYTSTDLYNWSYEGIVYDGGEDYFYMMETPDLFQIENTYYLLFSDIDSKNVYYRKSLSLNGPWDKPKEFSDRFDGNGFYAAKVITDYYGDHYIFGWTNRYEYNNDQGLWIWGGNLVVHKLYQLKESKDLAVTIPHTIKEYLEKFIEPIVKHSQWGLVEILSGDGNSYFLSSLLNYQITNIIFNPIELRRYKISLMISYKRSINDFGIMLGICDGYNHFYSLRFIPSKNRFSLEKINRSSLTSTTIPTTDVYFNFIPNRNYKIEILIENSMVITYLDDKVALTARIYRAIYNHWGIYVDNSDVTFKNILVTRS